jgi:DNA (cytosine-5)-methyltransferase 1
MITLGSLFDGIGGFPLAGIRNGIVTLWASEIEPFPIRVTKIRFPDMKHLGDVTKIDGAEIEPVDIITFGSPCQDLSVAGKRAGLAGERSGLFMEAIRIIREMREHEQSIGRADKHIRPRFAVWENVPGAFSSNKGEDFRAVLEETARVADKTVAIPKPPRGANGLLQEPSWETVGALPGVSWMLNSGESPSAAVESSLSQILEENPHPKYFLSAKACAGILRRAEKRGKELPPMLKEALERQARDIGEKELVV